MTAVAPTDSASLLSEYRQAVIYLGTSGALPVQTVEELLRGLDVICEAVRAEASGPSPVTEWLMGGFRSVRMQRVAGPSGVKSDYIAADADDASVSNAVLVRGRGATVEAALADAMNRLMANDPGIYDHERDGRETEER